MVFTLCYLVNYYSIYLSFANHLGRIGHVLERIRTRKHGKHITATAASINPSGRSVFDKIECRSTFVDCHCFGKGCIYDALEQYQDHWKFELFIVFAVRAACYFFQCDSEKEVGNKDTEKTYDELCCSCAVVRWGGVTCFRRNFTVE